MSFSINDRWRVNEDGELQWIIQQRRGDQWHSKAYCGSKAGLLEVALPRHRVLADGRLLAALWRLPEFYEPGALDALALDRAA